MGLVFKLFNTVKGHLQSQLDYITSQTADLQTGKIYKAPQSHLASSLQR